MDVPTGIAPDQPMYPQIYLNRDQTQSPPGIVVDLRLSIIFFYQHNNLLSTDSILVLYEVLTSIICITKCYAILYHQILNAVLASTFSWFVLCLYLMYPFLTHRSIFSCNVTIYVSFSSLFVLQSRYYPRHQSPAIYALSVSGMSNTVRTNGSPMLEYSGYVLRIPICNLK